MPTSDRTSDPTPADPLRALPLRYRLALALLPAHVRDEHARELRDEVSDDAPSTAALVGDVLRAAPVAHWDVLRQDLRLAFRQMRHARAFAITACLTLAAGIGGNVAFFTLVDRVLLRELPLAGADRVVDVTEENLGKGMRTFGISPANFRDYVADSSLFQAAAAYSGRSGTVRIGETRERISYLAVGGDFFRVFTQAPLLGRTLAPEDDVPGSSSAVLSASFWRGALGADPDVLGREVDVDGQPRRVVGVMPDGFDFPAAGTAFWQPIGLTADDWQERGARFVSAIARLRSGVTVAQASASLEGKARGLAAQYPKTNTGWSVLVRGLRDANVGGVWTPLLLVWGAGGLVLLIAVANVASLFLTRTVARRGELALRAALGARAGRVVRQLMTEGLVLATVGGAAGMGVAQLVIVALRPLAGNAIPRVQEVALGPRSALYAVVLVLITTGLLSALGAWPGRGRGTWSALGSARASISRGGRQLQRGIVVGEIALAVFVLIGGTLVTRTLVDLLSQPMGFVPDGLLTFRVEPPWHVNLGGPDDSVMTSYARDRRRADESYANLITRLEALPGVRRAGAINRLPLTGDWWTTGVRLPDKPTEDDRIPVYVRPVTSGYLDAMGTRLLRGRGLSADDVVGGERVIVVDAEFARRVWGDADPLGREVLVDGPPNAPPPRARVVGVVEPIHMSRLDGDLRATMYLPFAQAMEGHYLDWGMDVVVRGATPALEPGVRAAVREAFPDAVVFRVADMNDVIRQSTGSRRFQLTVLTFFGALALLLATMGVAGALLLAVRERRGELAVRMALGARGNRVWWGVQRDALAVAGAGALLGVGAGLAGARVFASVVYGVSVRDPLAFAVAPAVMLAAAFVAAAVPATRAVRVNPVSVLRE